MLPRQPSQATTNDPDDVVIKLGHQERTALDLEQADDRLLGVGGDSGRATCLFAQLEHGAHIARVRGADSNRGCHPPLAQDRHGHGRADKK